MLRQTNWGHWVDTSAYPTEIVVYPNEVTGVYQWEVKDYPTNTTYASSYAHSFEIAYEDALAAIKLGAICTFDVPAVMCYNTFIVAEGAPGATLFREVTRGTWVGFHAGKRIELSTNDKYKLPYFATGRIYEVETTHET